MQSPRCRKESDNITARLHPGPSHAEIDSAVIRDADRILVSSSQEADDFADEGDGSPFHAGCLGIFNLSSNTFESVVKTEETIGTMLWLGGGRVVGFYEHPKLVDVGTGKVLHRWPDIPTGKQDSSIIHHPEAPPAIALDPACKRFAVSSGKRIDVIQF